MTWLYCLHGAHPAKPSFRVAAPCEDVGVAAPCEDVESLWLRAMASASAAAKLLCPAAANDKFAHCGASRERIAKMPVDNQNHYLFLHAVNANCVACVQHWLDNGADVEKGSNTCHYSAFDWAEHAEAHDVRPLLETERFRKRRAGRRCRTI